MLVPRWCPGGAHGSENACCHMPIMDAWMDVAMSRPGKLVLQTVSRLFVVVFLSSTLHETRSICLKLARRIFIFLFISSFFNRKCAQSKYMFFSCRDATINVKLRLLFCSLKNAATHFKKCKNASSSYLDFIGVMTFLSLFSFIYYFPFFHDLKPSGFSLKYLFFFRSS